MSRDKPLVSICCITFNHENFIDQAIKGFLQQITNFEIEIIIHDDASSDNTAEIIQGYANKYPGLIVPIIQTVNQHSQGKKPLLDFVFPLAAGKYIAVCEGDDYWIDPHKLQKQVDFLNQNSGYSFCFHKAEVLIEDQEVKFREPFTTLPDNPVTFRDVVTGNFIPTASIVFRNNIDSFPEWFRHVSSGDRALFGLLALRGNGYYMPDKMAVYRKHLAGVSEELSTSFDVKINNSYRKLILYKGLNETSGKRYSDVLNPIIAGFYWGIMINGFRSGKGFTGLKSLFMVCRYDFRLIIRKMGKIFSRAFIS